MIIIHKIKGLINCAGFCSEFSLQNRTKLLMEMSWDVVFLVVQSRRLGPLKVGFIDVSMTISDSGTQHVIRNTPKLNQRNCLRSNFLEHESKCFRDQLLITFLEVTRVIASSHALLQELEAYQDAQIGHMNL